MAIDLHRLLNRIDVEKDATQTPVPIRDKTVFHKRADELFGPLLAPTYSEYVAMMKRIVAKYKAERAFVKEVANYESSAFIDIRIYDHIRPKIFDTL